MYRGEISYLDSQLKKLLELERVRQGIVAFTADHGENLGHHGDWWNHGGLYPSTLHVPLILRWPGAPGGTRLDRAVQNEDLGRTLLDLSGLEATPFPGTSLLAAASEGRPRFAIASGKLQASVTLGPHHLIMTLRRHRLFSGAGPLRELHQLELFDLERDPLCERDLVTEEPETAARLRALLVDWLIDAPSAGWAETGRSLDDEMRQSLAELGYTVGAEDDEELFDPDCACERCAVARSGRE
jgi:arylsulfatase A-like enzyme